MKKLLTFLVSSMILLAGCNSHKMSSSTMETKVYQADVVVIGAGGAGMAAALNAKNEGASVVILEKMNYAGGNTTRSEGGMNASETKFQKDKGIEDSVETMVQDTIKGGKELNDPELVEFLAKNSSDTVDWLTSIGMDLSDVGQGAGATNPRMHRPAGGVKVGGVLVPVLLKNLEEQGIPIIYQTKATKLTMENDVVNGVSAVDKDGNEITFKANAVIIATGGFGANEEMFAKYREDLKGFKTTNHPGATGDGITLAEEVGAATADMDKIQTNPTVEVTTQTVLSETVRGKGAIMVNKDGKRFTSEMLTRDVLSAAILEQPDKFAYLVFDQRVMDSMKALQENFKKGIITKGETIEDLAKAIEVDGAAFNETLQAWNAAVAAKADTAFQRETGMDADLSQAPYYAVKVSPAVHYTMGGIQINTNTEVLNTKGEIISGLYAVGEVTGGVHGGNRLGGNAVADIMVFGRQSGMVAGKYVSGKEKLEMMIPQAESEENPSVKGNFKDGTYTGIADGHEKNLKVEVVVEGGSIAKITVLESNETISLLQSVERDLIPEIIKKQSVEVDTVVGATQSSEGVIKAVESALESAK